MGAVGGGFRAVGGGFTGGWGWTHLLDKHVEGVVSGLWGVDSGLWGVDSGLWGVDSPPRRARRGGGFRA
eukprot:842346-Prorocentrum_minimum.AAC.1